MWIAVLTVSGMLLASATSSVRVETNVGGGDASVETRIETTVNGEKRVVESHEEGVVEVKATDDSYEVKKEGEVKSFVDETETGVTGEVTPSKEDREGEQQIDGEAVIDTGGGSETIEQESVGWVGEMMKKIKGWWGEIVESIF